MSKRASRSVVVLGTMSKMPVPGVIWQTVHYLLGLRRLGYEVTYVEAHARTPSMFVKGTPDHGSARAARFVRDALAPFGLGDRWAFHALHHDGSCLGMDQAALCEAYRSAELLLNLCGGTQPLPEHVETGRLVMVCTDPVQIEVELWKGRDATREFLDAHCAVVTFGENYGEPGCGVPVSPDYRPIPTRQPVILDLWDHDLPEDGRYTTVANWRQAFRPLTYRGELHHWSKDLEFEKFLDLPRRTGLDFELALASYRDEDRLRLEGCGWRVRDAADFGFDSGSYRTYIQRSRAEFTVAKDQNVRLRSGWFSDRSATYLAAGRPVVTQDTGFGETLPTGRGLFGVADLEAAAEAVAAIEADYAAARRAARDVARACFDYRVVLPHMLANLGVEGPARRFPLRAAVVDDGNGAAPGVRPPVAPATLVLEPESRRPLRLPADTVRTILARPIPERLPRAGDWKPARTVSIVVVTYGKLHLTRLCLESLAAHTHHPAYEVVVVDNASADGTPDYLRALAATHPRVRVILNPSNDGFAAACNQGVRAARGDVLVLLNNDVVLPPGWLGGLLGPLSDTSVGAVNPVTNRIGTPA
ncbi:MAG TPA: glycosyltransferase [Longimicrobiales bacterium]|nr:glycosyltransferase [Longimicrobiales bacterium]